MSTIPASQIVAVTPGVLAAGGSAVNLTGLMLTTSARIPVGTVQSFPDADSVDDYFGGASAEASAAAVYFQGFDNSNVKPGALLMAQYNTSAVGAFLRGGNVSDMTLAELQALNGFLGVVIDGVLKSATINLSAATSFSNAAMIIGAALGIHGPQTASVTGSIAATTLTVSAVASGVLAAGNVLSGTGVTAATYIAALASGTGGTGTYTVSPTQTALSQTITAYAAGVVYDSTSGAFQVVSSTTGAASTIAFGSGALATSLKLTSLTGAVISQGANAVATPAAFMDDLVDVNNKWGSFMTIFDPDGGSGTTNRLAFAAWNSTQNNRYAYIAWDTNAAPTTTVPATTSLGYLVAQAQESGTCVVFALDSTQGPLKAAFVCGSIASVDFDETNGRTTFAFRQQGGLVADVTSLAAAENLTANGYNYYGVWGTADPDFVFFYPGSVSGDFLWLDSYINQIWLNNTFQIALMTLLTSAKSIPYNTAGNGMIESGLSDTINAGLNFGAFRPGVALSASQIVQVNADAGAKIDRTLATRGWYLQVKPASAAVRAARGSPPAKFFYMDGGSIQSINLASVELQ